MEFYENSNNPNVFRTLKMEHLTDQTKGNLLTTSSKDARHRLANKKKELKVMLQQDRNDLDKSGELSGLKASRSMHLPRQTKSVSNAEKDRVKMSSQYQKLLKFQAKQEETNGIQMRVQYRSSKSKDRSKSANRTSQSRSRSASLPPAEQKVALDKLRLNPLNGQVIKDGKITSKKIGQLRNSIQQARSNRNKQSYKLVNGQRIKVN